MLLLLRPSAAITATNRKSRLGSEIFSPVDAATAAMSCFTHIMLARVRRKVSSQHGGYREIDPLSKSEIGGPSSPLSSPRQKGSVRGEGGQLLSYINTAGEGIDRPEIIHRAVFKSTFHLTRIPSSPPPHLPIYPPPSLSIPLSPSPANLTTIHSFPFSSAEAVFGPPGGRTVLICTLFASLGVCSAYVVFITENACSVLASDCRFRPPPSPTLPDPARAWSAGGSRRS